MKKLFLDDERIPTDVTWVYIDTGPWVVVRSFNQAVEWVLQNGFPDVISFDHDLGYKKLDSSTDIIVVLDATEEKSGYDFAHWLVEYDMDTNTMPLNFTFTTHSMNPVGAKNISQLLKNYMRSKNIISDK